MTPTRDTRAGGVPLSTVAVVFEKHCDCSILAGKFELDHLSDRPKTQQLRMKSTGISCLHDTRTRRVCKTGTSTRCTAKGALCRYVRWSSTCNVRCQVLLYLIGAYHRRHAHHIIPGTIPTNSGGVVCCAHPSICLL